jgi:hypothetical protein
MSLNYRMTGSNSLIQSGVFYSPYAVDSHGNKMSFVFFGDAK